MDKEKFLARKETVKTIEITLPGGDIVKARKLSQYEVEHMKKHYSKDNTVLEGFRYICVRTLLTDDGKKMLDDGEMDKLTGFDFDDLQKIASEVSKFSGLAVGKDDDGKND